MKLEQALTIAQEILVLLEPWVDRAEIAGSIRRRKPEVKDIEIVAIPSMIGTDLLGSLRPASTEIGEVLARHGRATKKGQKYIQIERILGSRITLDLFLVTPPATWGAIMVIRTGPAIFSQQMVTRLQGRGMMCREGRVLRADGSQVPTETEGQFFDACGVVLLDPWDRR